MRQEVGTLAILFPVHLSWIICLTSLFENALTLRIDVYNGFASLGSVYLVMDFSLFVMEHNIRQA